MFSDAQSSHTGHRARYSRTVDALRHSITRADKDIVQFLSWSLLLAPHAVQGDQERPFLSRELRRGVLTQGEKRISRDRALVIGEERRGAVRGVCE